ncbi:glycosyl transferase family 64 domain-containing protein [Jimgerdemannia flammicorona]|uniref:Glycosyl transferase family 64 domain-containing protein n=1 Tax=Jimgerdemannia flammicorona TaxID=994334 RepID=A0A433DBV3_9FUNG|nr:glycosyl transferase family 64 domain-containing protein [Jimgerdemannia flammicorona]
MAGSLLLPPQRHFFKAAIFVALIILVFVSLFWTDNFSSTVEPTTTSSNDVTTKAPTPDNSVVHAEDRKDVRQAYASFLCDQEMISAAMVLVHSIKLKDTTRDIVLLVLPYVSEDSRQELITLGAKIVEIEEVPFPFNATQANKGINKSCRYSKLHLWELTDYDKIIYLDADTMVVEKIDELFDFPEFSAVMDMGTTMNTGVFVMEPSKATFNRMMSVYLGAPSYNHGDQGFLNWYFNFTSGRTMSGVYNVMSKYKDYASGKALLRGAKVLHFTSETKPWSFYYSRHRDWEQNFDAGLFYWWIKTERTVQQILPNARQTEFSNWTNVGRVPYLCDNYTPKFEGRFPAKNQFSVLISTYNPERIVYLAKLIQHYAESPSVHTIFVTWHNPNLPISRQLANLGKTLRVPLRFLRQNYDSLNNRFNPITSLRTPAVFICDDDIRVPIDDLEFAFEVWKTRQNSIVGQFPRMHKYFAENHTAEYVVSGPRHPKYSIILTKSMFMKADFLFAYTCLLPPKIHKYVDDNLNCEDIAINMMATGMTGSLPQVVDSHGLRDFGTSKGISTQAGHMRERSKCIADLIGMFNGTDPLLYNIDMSIRFNAVHFTKEVWDDWDKTLENNDGH